MTDPAISKAARMLSKRGSSKGGKARFTKLTAEERSAIARKAAQARWGTPQRTTEGAEQETANEGNG